METLRKGRNFQHGNGALPSGMIFDVKRFSIHDGPGIRTTVFLKGCPLSCLWCHNPESMSPAQESMHREGRCIQCLSCQEACPEGAIALLDGAVITDESACVLCGSCVDACPTGGREIVGREVTVAQVIAEIEKDVIFYDESGGGVTFSGGEPLLQYAFLSEVLRACKEKSIHTTVDTSGFAAPKVLDEVSESVDLFLYDLKVMDDQKHRELTGVPNGPILRNLQQLSSQGIPLIIRVPCIPGATDGDDNIRRIGEFVSSLAHPPQVDVLPYHKAGVTKYERLGKNYILQVAQSLPDGRIEEIQVTLQGFGLHVTIGGQ